MAHICKYRKNKEFGKLYSEHGHESVRDGAPADRQTDRPRSRSRRQQQSGWGLGRAAVSTWWSRHADPRAGSRGAESGRGEERKGEEEKDRRRRRRAGEEGDGHSSGLGAWPRGLRLPPERSAALPHAEPPRGSPPGAQGRGLQAAPMLPAWVKLVAEKAFPSLLPCSSWPCPTAGGGVRSCCCCHNQMG